MNFSSILLCFLLVLFLSLLLFIFLSYSPPPLLRRRPFSCVYYFLSSSSIPTAFFFFIYFFSSFFLSLFLYIYFGCFRHCPLEYFSFASSTASQIFLFYFCSTSTPCYCIYRNRFCLKDDDSDVVFPVTLIQKYF